MDPLNILRNKKNPFDSYSKLKKKILQNCLPNKTFDCLQVPSYVEYAHNKVTTVDYNVIDCTIVYYP